MWLTKAHTSQEAPTSTSGSSSLLTNNISYKIHMFNEKIIIFYKVYEIYFYLT